MCSVKILIVFDTELCRLNGLNRAQDCFFIATTDSILIFLLFEYRKYIFLKYEQQNITVRQSYYTERYRTTAGIDFRRFKFVHFSIILVEYYEFVRLTLTR